MGVADFGFFIHPIQNLWRGMKKIQHSSPIILLSESQLFYSSRNVQMCKADKAAPPQKKLEAVMAPWTICCISWCLPAGCISWANKISLRRIWGFHAILVVYLSLPQRAPFSCCLKTRFQLLTGIHWGLNLLYCQLSGGLRWKKQKQTE